MDDPLTTAEAATLLGVHAKTLQRWRSLNLGPQFVKCGYRSFWYLRADVDAFAQSKYVALAANPEEPHEQ